MSMVFQWFIHGFPMTCSRPMVFQWLQQVHDFPTLENHGHAASHWKTMDLLQSLENYGPAASHTKIMKKSMENHGSAVSQWNTMDLLQVIRKPWTCCKS
jgi:hypothetical protein